MIEKGSMRLKTILLLVSLPFFLGTSFGATPAQSVNPFIGTAASNVSGDAVPGGKGGATQPAAVVPFGMVQIGPDTDRPETSGYNFANSSIRNFSLTHLSGPGCRSTGEVAFMPFSGAPNWPLPSASKFSKKNESASAGLYHVRFDGGLSVDLTATERTGMVRMRFPSQDKTVGVLFNTGINGDGKTTGLVRATGPRTLVGEVRGSKFCNAKGTYMVYFAVEFDRDIESFDFENDLAKIVFSDSGKPLLMKVGISYVSTAGAELNLRSENPGHDFDAVRGWALSKWEKALSVIEIDPKASSDLKTIFYTALYHSLLHPNLGGDVDGRYLGFDNKIHRSERPYYQTFSGWDIYRSQVQLLAFLFPDRASDIAQSMVTAGEECGSFPKWAINNVEANIMSGDPGAMIVANLAAFGAEDFDHNSALAIMKRNSTDPKANCQGHTTRWGAADYINRGFIPEPVKEGNWSTASIMLELVSADFAIGNYAYDHGDFEFAKSMVYRSTNWRKLWDPSTKLVRPLDTNGQRIADFSATSRKGFMEGNSAQYTWMVPHDLSTLVEVMGGDEATKSRLDDFLSQTNAGQSAPYLYLGNEPAFGVPWIYLWAHCPWAAQKSIRKLLSQEFKNGPSGLTGNDDLGALSSWYVWNSLGLYPALPGIAGVVIGSPAFSEIKITPEGRRPLRLLAPKTEEAPYVAALSVGGKSWSRTWISLRALRDAGELSFTMSATPAPWGSEKGAEPPSLKQGVPIRWPIGQD